MKAPATRQRAWRVLVLIALASTSLAAAPAKKPAPRPAEAPAPAIAPDAPVGEPRPPLLDFCAPPVQPVCIDAAGTYANPKERAACDADMQRYVRSVFAYRICLNAEMERAVRSVNIAIQHHKCLMNGGKKC